MFAALQDSDFCERIIETHLQSNHGLSDATARETLSHFLRDNSTNYIISGNVINSIDFIKLKKPYDYSVFNKLTDGNKSFLLPDGSILKISKSGDLMRLGYIFYSKQLQVGWHFWKADLKQGESFFGDKEVFMAMFNYSVDIIEHKAFALLCFVFLSDVITKEISPNSKSGTQKSGRVLNDTSHKFIYVNNDWNTVYVRSSGFTVSGHFALRWIGKGRNERRIVFIEPYQKKGYTRTVKHT